MAPSIAPLAPMSSSAAPKKGSEAGKKTVKAPGKRAAGNLPSAGQRTIGAFFAPTKEPAKPMSPPQNDGVEMLLTPQNETLPSQTPSRPKKEKDTNRSDKANALVGNEDSVMVVSDTEEQENTIVKGTPPTTKKVDTQCVETIKAKETEDSGNPANAANMAEDKSSGAHEKSTATASDHKCATAAQKPSPAKSKTKKEDLGPKQGTLDFGKCAMKDWKEIWKKKERPPHPTGTELDLSDRHVMVLQFVSTFQQPLSLPELTPEDLKKGLESPDDYLAPLHTKILRTIVRDGETPDEERLLDEDTWPEVLRQHLQDVHGLLHESIWGRLEKQEYGELTAEERLNALVVLVDDCLATKTVRKVVDGSLDQLEELRRQQMMDEIQEKCRKAENGDTHAGELDVFVEEVAVDDGETEGMTERQRAAQKQKEEEARAQRIAEEKRAREEKRHAEEESKRKEQDLRARREETRAAQLLVHGSTVRVPRLAVQDYNYWVMDCVDGGRRLVCEHYESEGSSASKWSMHTTGKQYVDLLEYWNPKHPENDAKFQKKLREFMPPAVDPKERKGSAEAESGEGQGEDVEVVDESTKDAAASGPVELMEDDGDKETRKDKCGAADDADMAERNPIVSQAIVRARAAVLCLDEYTPDDMYADYKAYHEQREAWREAVEAANDLDLLKSSVTGFESFLKKVKMQEGWEVVQAKWLADVAAAVTVAGLSYLVKQLRVYIGKQKPRPGKLAPIFAGPLRMTRMRARAEAGLPQTRKRLADESSAEEDDEQVAVESSGGEHESAGEEWKEEEEPEQPKVSVRTLRGRKAAKIGKASSAGAASRGLRSSSRLAGRSTVSLREESAESSESEEEEERVQARRWTCEVSVATLATNSDAMRGLGRRSDRATSRRQKIEDDGGSSSQESEHSAPTTRRSRPRPQNQAAPLPSRL